MMLEKMTVQLYKGINLGDPVNCAKGILVD